MSSVAENLHGGEIQGHQSKKFANGLAVDVDWRILSDVEAVDIWGQSPTRDGDGVIMITGTIDEQSRGPVFVPQCCWFDLTQDACWQYSQKAAK